MVANNAPRAPAGLGPVGRGVWRDLHEKFGFSPAERLVVVEIARIADALAELDAQVRREGRTITVPTKAGEQVKANPAAVEARQLQVTLARLVASLRLPDGEGAQPQRRAVRGVHPGPLKAVR